MVYTKTLIKKAYVAFNERDVEGALALMSDDVSWPKASEGGKVIGKNEIRAYWARQCSVFDPHVEPREIVDVGGGKTEVRVHQIVRSLEGDILSDSEVRHVFTIEGDRIKSMELTDEAGSSSRPSAAFAKH